MKFRISFLIVFFIVAKSFSINTTDSSLNSKEKITLLNKKDSLTYYVIAKSGLNYRAAPNGKVLGKLPLNTKVNIVECTNVYNTIIDEGEPIGGEWVGIKKDAKTVYIFDAFLSTKKYIPKLNIYNVSSYQKDNSKSSYGYITLTDGYPWDKFNIIDDIYLEDNDIVYHQLKGKYRTQFLKGAKIKETDSVYIYNYFIDTLYTYIVSDLVLLAKPSPYGSYKPITQDDYLIGFDLKSKLDLEANKRCYDAFVYIGESNPFIKGKMKPIVWEVIDDSLFPSVDFSDYENRYEGLVEMENEPKHVFKFQFNNYNYYFKIFNNRLSCLVVLLNDDVVYKAVFSSSEGESPAPISEKKGVNNYFEQWTGVLFKNKPPVIFGFMYYSFSCSGIDFLDKTEPTIWKLCDCSLLCFYMKPKLTIQTK